MVWQDLMITCANIVFSVSLVPQIYEGFKKKQGAIRLETSGPVFLALYLLSFAFFTLELYLSSLISVLTGTLWLTLFAQRIIYRAPATISE